MSEETKHVDTADDKARRKQEKAEEKARAEKEAAEASECDLRREILQGRIGKLVTYYDDGHRVGFLVALHRVSADIQPLGVIKGSQPRLTSVAILDTRPNDSPSKYETLDDYITAMGWDKPKPAAPVVNRPAPVSSELFTADQALVETASMTGGFWNPDRAVELFKSGMKIIDIAVEMGYPRGSGCNRTKAALKKAGVLE